MKTEIKFTTDNKKVVIIGSLNSQEKIVQEIFIVDGSEVPSGEHFVVKTLHDAPAVSWKESNLKKINDEYDATKFRVDNELKVLNDRFKTISTELRNKIEYAGKVLKNVSPDSFNTLVDYLTGEIKYIVKTGQYAELIEWHDFTQHYEKELRLISIYGKDDGFLTYAIGQYYDFSGGNKYFKPFNNYEDAFSCFTKEVLSAYITDDIIKQAKKYNINLDKDKLKEFYSKQEVSLKQNIENYNTQILKWQDQIKTLNP